MDAIFLSVSTPPVSRGKLRLPLKTAFSGQAEWRASKLQVTETGGKATSASSARSRAADAASATAASAASAQQGTASAAAVVAERTPAPATVAQEMRRAAR
jgi:hypothetical protein